MTSKELVTPRGLKTSKHGRESQVNFMYLIYSIPEATVHMCFGKIGKKLQKNTNGTVFQKRLHHCFVPILSECYYLGAPMRS